MSGARRALLVSIPAVGHAVGLGSIGAELVARGHAVAWACPLARPLLPYDAVRYPVDAPRDALPLGRSSSVRALFGEALPALARLMLPGVEAAIDAFQPDVLVVEGSALAGVIAARRRGLPTVVVHSAPTLLWFAFDGMHSARRWADERLAAPQREAGIAPAPWPLRGDAGTIVPATRALLPPDAALAEGDRLVGPLLAHRDTGARGPGGHAVVSLGTVVAASQAALLDRAVEAASARTGVWAAGDAARASAAWPGVAWSPWLPLPDLFDGAALFVGHGGFNSTSEALWHGVPCLLAPVAFDQPAVAARVVALGAGLRVGPDADAATLRAAVARLLDEPSFAARAQEVSAELRGAGGTAAAAELVVAS